MANAMAWGGILLALLTGTFLLFLQIRTYKRTGHKSLAVAAIAQAFGLACGALQVVPHILSQSVSTRWTLFYLANACLFVECVVGALGAVLIFRAFEQALQLAGDMSPGTLSSDHQVADR
ncbi:hypothetical protein [Dyella choica]|uniref:Uncharacterized protein n=1 Tax=Dyella choica TaxID=1927959 RepID=A0A3S0RGZ1_9GAMM|nr:hypothetical protein [Dyella choica]RUL67698.1 hypothetical protein EKH80_23655 [Dyella choica]